MRKLFLSALVASVVLLPKVIHGEESIEPMFTAADLISQDMCARPRQGPPGPTGPQGPTGPTGVTGPTGAAPLFAVAHFYNDSSDEIILEIGQPVPFISPGIGTVDGSGVAVTGPGQVGDFIVTSTTFQVPFEGTYRVTVMLVIYTSGETPIDGNQVGVYLGTSIPGTGPSSGQVNGPYGFRTYTTDQELTLSIDQMVAISDPVNQAINIRANSPFTLANNAGENLPNIAELTIEYLGPVPTPD